MRLFVIQYVVFFCCLLARNDSVELFMYRTFSWHISCALSAAANDCRFCELEMMLHLQRCTSRDNSNTYSSSQLCFSITTFVFGAAKKSKRLNMIWMLDGDGSFAAIVFFVWALHSWDLINDHGLAYAVTHHFDVVLRGMRCVCVCICVWVQFLRSLHKRCTCRRAALLHSFHFKFYFYSFKLILTSQTGQWNSASYRPSRPLQANRFIRKSRLPHAVRMHHRVRYYCFCIHIVVVNRHKDDCV